MAACAAYEHGEAKLIGADEEVCHETRQTCKFHLVCPEGKVAMAFANASNTSNVEAWRCG
jgi:hypothetical protein